MGDPALLPEIIGPEPLPAPLLPTAEEMAEQFKWDYSMDDGYYDMDNELYHDHRILSSSHVKVAADQSPLHLLHQLWDKHYNPHYKHVSKPAYGYGTCLHTAVLEPDEVESTLVVWPTDEDGLKWKKPTVAQLNAKEPPAKTKALIAKWEEFNAVHEGKLLLSQAEVDSIFYLRDKAYEDPEISDYLTAADREIETSVFYQYTCGTLCSDLGKEILGKEVTIPTRVRPDLWIPGERHVIDVKSARSCHPDDFRKAVFKLGYDVSAWFYLDVLTRITGKRHLKFSWIAFEKTPPYEINIHHADLDTLEIGKLKTNEAMAKIARGTHSQKWAGYRKNNVVSPTNYQLREYGLDGLR